MFSSKDFEKCWFTALMRRAQGEKREERSDECILVVLFSPQNLKENLRKDYTEAMR